MKGIAHFISGIAVATFVPDAVRQASAGSFVLVLGGMFALLPDTVDFRFVRFFEAPDEEIDPDPHAFDPQSVAERIAATMRAAYETGQPRSLLLHTARAGADLWRSYRVRFEASTGEVAVHVGALVSTAGAPLPGSEPTAEREGRALVGVPLAPTYGDEIRIDAFSGPSFRFEKDGEGVRIEFLPWHRSWSHSLVVAAAVGLGMGLLLGPVAGAVSGLGLTIHAFQDQLGYMGTNLLWPFTQRRTHGLGLFHSGDAAPNFLTVWTALALILFNLDRFSNGPRLEPLPYLSLAVGVPILAFGGHTWRARHRDGPNPPPEAQRQGELLSETEELEL